MLEFIKRLILQFFPYEVETMEELVEIAKESSCKSVEAESYWVVRNNSNQIGSTGPELYFGHMLRFVVINTYGQKAIYQERVYWGTANVYNLSRNIGDNQCSDGLATKIKELKTKLPEGILINFRDLDCSFG